MGFMIQSVDNGHVPTIEYLPCSAIKPTVGMALVLNGGNLAVASGTTKPTYISMVEKDAACAAGDIIPVIRILPEMVFEVPFSVAASAVKLGNKLTIATGGAEVTATTTDGVAEVVGILGTAAGDKCHVRLA